MECLRIPPNGRLKILAQSVALVSDQAGQKLIIAELIRTAFFSLRRDSKDDRLIYVRSILDYVRTRFKLINNKIGEDDDLFRNSGIQNLNEIVLQVMDDLDLVGDIAEASSGYWTELSDRYVVLNDTTVVLLSSLPTFILKERLVGLPVGVQSLARTCSKLHTAELKKYGFVEQSIRSWIADFNWDPEKFLNEMISTATADLKQVDMQDDFKVYAPDRNGDRKQAFRWLDKTKIGVPSTELYLCKRTGRNSIPVYWLGQLVYEEGEVLGINEFRIHSNTSLKMQFCLDFKFEAKNSVFENVDGNVFHFEFDFRLPFELHRLFSVLAISDTYPDRWVRRLTFLENSADFVRAQLKNMKVNIITR